MCIYRLPTHGVLGYHGQYPERIRSWSAGSAVSFVHIELNNGDRYVATRDCLRESWLGVGYEFTDALAGKWRLPALETSLHETIPLMEHEQYEGLLKQARERMALRHG
jgi:hypothetical protein